MAAESLVSAMRNSTDVKLPNYIDMNDTQRSNVHEFFCDNADVIFEENSNNRSSLIRNKNYFNATCDYMSKYWTTDFNLRFFFYMATGPNHDKF